MHLKLLGLPKANFVPSKKYLSVDMSANFMVCMRHCVLNNASKALDVQKNLEHEEEEEHVKGGAYQKKEEPNIMWLYILPILSLLMNCQHSIASPAIKNPSSSADPFSTALDSFNSFWTSVIPKKPLSSTQPISNLLNFANIFSPSVPSKQTVPRSSVPRSSSIMNLSKNFWTPVIPNQPIAPSSAPPFSSALNSFGTFLKSLIPNKPLSSYPPISTALNLEKIFLPLTVFSPSRKQTNPPNSAPPVSTVLDSRKTLLNPVTKEQHILYATSEKPSILEEKEMVQKEQSDLDLHTTNHSLPTSADIETPAPTLSTFGLPQDMKDNTDGKEGSVATLSHSNSDNLMNTTIPELSESSILEEKEKYEEEMHKNEEEQEKTEEHEEEEEVQEEHSSTTIQPITSTTPDNDPIYDVSNVCEPNSQCYVSPKNCSSRCEVIYSKNPYDIFSCFETAAYCLYGWEGHVLEYDFHRGSTVKPVGWDKMDNDKYVWTFNKTQPPVKVGKGDKLQFRIDPERDVVGGPFQELFLKSNE
ncbi:Protein CBG07794 [Caenorhabditis briggsae]|uniref:Protein CBG07794 n=1 Tax=Caenorhabditis briggsae TaxID=6238 RepID=A8X427_CAEBR|nr:Protein CBG07794 [Caenorhabditis briggsae]CAP27387.2 Protein CBG07794 [Caenorhabditis briggsae]